MAEDGHALTEALSMHTERRIHELTFLSFVETLIEKEILISALGIQASLEEIATHTTSFYRDVFGADMTKGGYLSTDSLANRVGKGAFALSLEGIISSTCERPEANRNSTGMTTDNTAQLSSPAA